MATAILLVDHGSRLSEANDMLADVAQLVSNQNPNVIVESAHMELASPSIADGIASCVSRGASHIVVFPYMLSPGRHATRDIPDLTRDAMNDYPDVTYSVTGPLGTHPLLATIILDVVGNLDK